MTKPILLAGETFAIVQSVAQGFDVSTSSNYANGATRFLACLRSQGYAVEHLGTEQCEADFPRTSDALAAYSAVILSDIGALTLLFTPESRSGNPSVNRLVLLRDYVEAGGSLMMAGGYTSFQGMHGTARYHGAPIEECLPVTCLPYSDGLEAPEGLLPQIRTTHPITAGLPQTLPPILGLNRVVPRAGADIVIDAPYRGKSHPLLVAWSFGKGRALAWTTDIGPHWMSTNFMADDCYGLIMGGMAAWLCGDR